IRDSILCVSGCLNTKVGGPGILVPLDAEVTSLIYKGTWQPTKDVSEHSRRSVYLFVKRNLPNPLLEAFDTPANVTSCSVRSISTHAGQALSLFNSRFIGDMARQFAIRLIKETSPAVEQGRPSNVEPIIQRAYWLTVGRSATAIEISLTKKHLERQTDYLENNPAQMKSAPPAPFLPESDQQTDIDDDQVALQWGLDEAWFSALQDFCLVMLNLDEFVTME
ncbi:MAG: DUF1553 domain-containing protein, partial [Planctomycetes bacterium]|nr:DUF1553 domain-containing protein [Planctomycetota bacterium]